MLLCHNDCCSNQEVMMVALYNVLLNMACQLGATIDNVCKVILNIK